VPQGAQDALGFGRRGNALKRPTSGYGTAFRKIKALESSKATLDIFTTMNGDDDFPLCMSFFAITNGFRYLA